MKKIILGLSFLSCFASVMAQVEKNDSTTVNLDDAVIVGEYYKKYLKKDPSQSLRLDESILEIPQNVSIITNQALSDQQVISMSDALVRNVSGAIRLEHWGDLYSRINMRGSRAAAFLNGVNVTSNWGPLNEDMSYVDHIEFVKGPAGFLMSNGEPSGIYNIVTKKATGKELNGSAKFTFGSYDLYRAEADIDTKINDKLAVRFNLMGQNKGSFRPNEFNDRYIANTSLRYEIDEKTILTAEYRYQKAKMSDVGSAYVFSLDGYGTFPVEYTISDPKLPEGNIDEHTVNLNLQHQISKDWKITAQGTYLNDYTMSGDTWPSSLSTDGSMYRYYNYWEALNEMKFGQVFVNGSVETGNIKHKILAGLDVGNKKYMADWGQGFVMDNVAFNIYNPTPMTGTVTPFDNTVPLRSRALTIAQTYTGVYLQDELRFFDESLRLTLAARYTNAEDNNYGTISKAEKLTPRIGISYSIDDVTSVYGLFDQSFVPQAGIIRSGEEVKPLTGNNIEFGGKREWANGKWFTSLSLYRILKNNELASDPANSPSEFFSVVMGKTKTQGVEFDLKGEIVKGFNVIFNYAYTDSEITDSRLDNVADGTLVPGFAKHAVNGWLNYSFQKGAVKGLGVNFGGTYLADRSSWSWTDTPGLKNMNDYLKFDAGVSYHLNKMEINLNVFNLFDRYLYSGSPYTFGDVNAYYYQAEAPRNWRLSIGYNF